MRISITAVRLLRSLKTLFECIIAIFHINMISDIVGGHFKKQIIGEIILVLPI